MALLMSYRYTYSFVFSLPMLSIVFLCNMYTVVLVLL